MWQIRGGDQADADAYWSAMEHKAVTAGRVNADDGDGGGDEEGGSAGDGLSIRGFCGRSETRRRPRAAYSPYCRATVRVLDHDCAYLGVAIGAGNHRTFMLFLLCAMCAIVAGIVLAVATPPPWIGLLDGPIALPGAEWIRVDSPASSPAKAHGDGADSVRTRLMLLGVFTGVGVLIPLAILTHAQIGAILSNVTTVEQMRWARTKGERLAMGKGTPSRGHPQWREYAPFDLGSRLANLAAFVQPNGREPPRHRA